MRVAFYSHDSYGLGHLRRCVKLASALSDQIENVRGLIITGSEWSHLFDAPAGFAYHRLHPIVKVDSRRYESRLPGVAFNDAMEARRRQIELALERFEPDLLVVDNVPCGLGGELTSVLARAREGRGPRLVLALRDVLDSPEAVRDQWSRAAAYHVLEECYDEIWIFGEAGGPDLRADYGLSDEAAERVIYCGRVASSVERHRDPHEHRPSRRPVVLVTGGGGGDADRLVEFYCRSLRHASVRPHSQVVLGPDFPADQLVTADAYDDVTITGFCSDLPAAIAHADAVVSMAGYNTTCEILEVGTPAVLVPRVWPRREQWLRASALAAAGRVQCLDPDVLTPKLLWQAVEAALAQPRFAPCVATGGWNASRRAVELLDADRRVA